MKKKGFTLVEVLAVITIIAILGLISIPIIGKVIDNSKLKARNTQINMIIETARKWSTENVRLLSDDPEEPYYLGLEDLINSKYLNGEPIIDPYTGLEMDGCVSITYTTNYKQYDYEYVTCPSNPIK